MIIDLCEGEEIPTVEALLQRVHENRERRLEQEEQHIARLVPTRPTIAPPRGWLNARLGVAR